MKYKISTYVLLVVLAGFVIYACGDKKDKNEFAEESSEGDTAMQITAANMVTEELADSLTAAAHKITRKSGGLVKASEAKAALKKFQQTTGIDCGSTNTNVIYGYSFGMEKFLEFADSVRKLDEKHGSKLKGVRVYFSMSKKDLPGGTQWYQDVFLSPIGEDGNDYYHVDDCKPVAKSTREDGGTVLNTSIPCPNQCE